MLETVKEPSIVKAVSFIRHMSADEKTKELARLEEKRLHDEASIIGTARRQGIAEGKAAGLAKGLAKGKIESVRTLMRNAGISEEKAIELLGISKPEYKKYVNTANKPE